MTTDPRRTDAEFHYLNHRRGPALLAAARHGHGDGPAMQLVELVCPSNPQHTLGLVITDDTGRVRLKTQNDPDGPRVQIDGPHLVYRCHACRRSGTGTAGRVEFANILNLAAALAWSHPTEGRRPLRRNVKAAPTRRDLTSAQYALLAANDDAHRAARRAFRDVLTRAAQT